MERLNYSTHAIESLQKLQKLLNPRISKDNYLSHNNDFVIRWLQNSAKFMLPHGGRIMDANYEQINPLTHFKLPYNEIAIEFSVTQDPSPGEIACPKRIALCKHYTSITQYIYDFYTGFPHEFLKLLHDKLSEFKELIVLLPLNYIYVDEVGFEWTCGASHTVFANTIQISSCVVDDHIAWDMTDTFYYPFGFYGLDAFAQGYSAENASKDTSDEVNALFQLLICLNCRNIELHKDSAPAKLNQKRKRNSKVEFFDYHVLTVRTNSSKTSNKGTTGKKIREHLRRGHPRTLPNFDRPIWIPSTTVNAGNGNFIDKDYRLLY